MVSLDKWNWGPTPLPLMVGGYRKTMSLEAAASWRRGSTRGDRFAGLLCFWRHDRLDFLKFGAFPKTSLGSFGGATQGTQMGGRNKLYEMMSMCHGRKSQGPFTWVE